MATPRKTTKKYAKPTLRVLAWRVTAEQFDALTAAAKKHGRAKTHLLNQGLCLALKDLGEEAASKRFAS